MEAVERIRANTGKAEPLRDSEEASGFSGLPKKKKSFFFCASYGSRASEACLSVLRSGLDRVLLCLPGQAIATAAGVFATALRMRPWLVALALRFYGMILIPLAL